MESWPILMKSLWAGLFAGGQSVLLRAPPRYLGAAALCGFAGRLVRDVFSSLGLGQLWPTAAASAVVVLVAVAVTRRHLESPVVLISGVLPLGASVAMFNAIIDLMRVSTLQGEALSAASISFSANAGKAFTTSLAIALGLGVGIAVARLFRRRRGRAGG